MFDWENVVVWTAFWTVMWSVVLFLSSRSQRWIDRRYGPQRKSEGYWLPPRRWKTLLYKRFGRVAPDRWVPPRR